ncbi:GlcNAc-PI de-N-acetylase, partial [Paenibacillus riograndensis]
MDSSILFSLMSPPDLTECRRILCIQPHPDDNEVGMGGTISAFSATGGENHYLTVTNGDCVSTIVKTSHVTIRAMRYRSLATVERTLRSTACARITAGG